MNEENQFENSSVGVMTAEDFTPDDTLIGLVGGSFKIISGITDDGQPVMVFVCEMDDDTVRKIGFSFTDLGAVAEFFSGISDMVVASIGKDDLKAKISHSPNDLLEELRRRFVSEKEDDEPAPN